MAQIAVIGAGVIGVSSAYLLAKAGYEVILIDAANAPGTGASAGNAAQLSWAYGDAMASPALLRHLPAIACGRDPAFRIRWQLDPDFMLWGLKFIANATASRWWANTRFILELAALSRQELAALVADVDIAFDYRLAGKLHLYADTSSLNAARPVVERKNALGFDQRFVTRSEAELIEPALARYQGDIAGAVHTPGDALGDAAGFCSRLTARMASHHGVSTAFGRQVAGLVQHRGRLCAIRFTDRDELAVDRAVVCLGAQSCTLAPELAELRAVRPVRGYSLTVARNEAAPLVSLTDVKRKLAFASIGDRFRVAGIADIERPGRGFDGSRFAVLETAANAVLPDVFRGAQSPASWSGMRPVTPSSRPIISPSRCIKGLYFNAGHGMLGWTLALGSARRLTELVGS